MRVAAGPTAVVAVVVTSVVWLPAPPDPIDASGAVTLAAARVALAAVAIARRSLHHLEAT